MPIGGPGRRKNRELCDYGACGGRARWCVIVLPVFSFSHFCATSLAFFQSNRLYFLLVLCECNLLSICFDRLLTNQSRETRFSMMGLDIGESRDSNVELSVGVYPGFSPLERELPPL